jgi:hypothetical protein
MAVHSQPSLPGGGLGGGAGGPVTNSYNIFVPGPYDLWLQITNYQVVHEFSIGLPGSSPPTYNVSKVWLVYHGVVQGANYQVYTSPDLTVPLTNWTLAYSFVANTNNPTINFTYDYYVNSASTGFFILHGPPLPRYTETDWETALRLTESDPMIQTSFNYGLYSGAVMVAGMFCFTMIRTISDSGNEEL